MRRAFVLAGVVLAACSRGTPRHAAISQQDDWQRTVALPAPARRIVSLAPATTELVFALGLGDRLVGRTTWCDWPAEATRVTDVGNGIGPNVEAVAAQHPDLVLIYPSESNRAAVAQLDGLGIPTAALKQDAIADWRSTVRWVAQATGLPERAESLLADFDHRLAAAQVHDTAGPSVFIAVGANPPLAIGAGSFISEVVTLAGGRNAFADLAGPSGAVSLEVIVARRPDAIMVLGPDSVIPDVTKRPGWRAIPAVREGRVIAVDGSAFNRPSPRLPEAVRILAARLTAQRRAP